MTRKNVLLGGAGLLLLLGVAWFVQNHEGLRRDVYLRLRMHEATAGVYVRDGIPEQQERALVDLLAAGRARAEAWFGPLQNRVTVVFAHDAATKGELGLEHAFAWNPIEERNERLYVGPKGLSVDLVAHGLAHAEIKARMGVDRWPELPAWFDEGVATQCDWRPFLLPEALGRAEDVGVAAMRPWDDHAAFEGSQGEDALVVAKREVTRWLAAAGGAAAFDALLAALRAGESFASAYARLEAADQTP